MTTDPNTFAAQFRNRMPVTLSPADYEVWLTGSDDEAFGLLSGLPSDQMQLIGQGERMREEPDREQMV